MNKMYILRGVPGAGKSTFTRTLPADRVTCSADTYFTDPVTGEYRFDPAKLGAAHQFCFRTAVDAVRKGCPVVVVDNTNTTPTEVSPYVLLGESYGYRVTVVTIEAPSLEIAAARNLHGAAYEDIRRMDANLRTLPLPPWWETVTVQGGT